MTDEELLQKAIKQWREDFGIGDVKMELREPLLSLIREYGKLKTEQLQEQIDQAIEMFERLPKFSFIDPNIFHRVQLIEPSEVKYILSILKPAP